MYSMNIPTGKQLISLSMNVMMASPFMHYLALNKFNVFILLF